MNKALIEGATHNPGAPANWTPEDGHCGGLPIKLDLSQPQSCYSAWKPTSEELATLNNGGYVILRVVGWQVPVALFVTDKHGAQELE